MTASTGHGAPRQGGRHRPEPHRPHPALQSRPPTPAFTPIRELFAGTAGSQNHAATNPAVSPSTSRAGAAKPARATASSRWKCTSCPMSMYPAISARASATTAKRWKSATRANHHRSAEHDRRARRRAFFDAMPAIARKLQTLIDVGWATSRWASRHHAVRRRSPAGQAVAGTGQARHRQDHLYPRRAHHRPAFPRHPQLLAVLSEACASHGNTIVVIEHNLDVIKTADWSSTWGRKAASGGGQIIATGTPEQVAANPGLAYRSLPQAFTAAARILNMDIIRSRQNPLVKHLIKLAENQTRAAQKNQQTLLIGAHLVSAAMDARLGDRSITGHLRGPRT
jgi:hypothetical protein